MRRMYSKSQIERIIDEHGGGGGAVDSVNGKTGEVVLNATDIKLTTNKSTVQNNFLRIDAALENKQHKLTYVSEDAGAESLVLGDTNGDVCPKQVLIGTIGETTNTSIYSDSSEDYSSSIELVSSSWNSGKEASIIISSSDGPEFSLIKMQADEISYYDNTLIAYDTNRGEIFIYANQLPHEDPNIAGVIYVDSDGTLKVSMTE